MSTQQLLNTLYVTTPEAYLHLDNDTVRVVKEYETLLRVPLLHLQGIVVFGTTQVSTPLIHRCAAEGIALAWFGANGHFQARLSGPVSGNVLLRTAQYQAASEAERALAIARCTVAAKIHNSRMTVLRSARDVPADQQGPLREAALALEDRLKEAPSAADLDVLRGLEGSAARAYFGAFSSMLTVKDDALRFSGRNRRPPRDPPNALLSFLYALMLHDCEAGAEAVGLDPQVGFLHAARPGRPSLALDLMEEFRSVFADRLALTLMNRRQVRGEDFVFCPGPAPPSPAESGAGLSSPAREEPSSPATGGAVEMKDEARKKVLVAYQERKLEEVHHPVLDRKVPWGLIPHVQAQLLARTLRGEVETYPAFLLRG